MASVSGPGITLYLDIATHTCTSTSWFCPSTPGLYSHSRRTSYRKITWCFETGNPDLSCFNCVEMWQAPRQPRCMWIFLAKRSLKHPISHLWDFKQFGGKTSYRLVNKDSKQYFSLVCTMVIWCWNPIGMYYILPVIWIPNKTIREQSYANFAWHSNKKWSSL